MSRHALLAGATGLIGSHLLTALLADPRYGRVTIIGRQSPATTHARLHVLRSDFNNLSVHAAELKADDVFCALGTTLAKAGSRDAFAQVDHDFVLALAQATRRAGSHQFLLVSAVGSSLDSPSFYSRTKARAEQSVRTLGFPALHIVRPSLLIGARSESRPMETLAQKMAPGLALLTRGPLARYQPVTADRVSSALIRIALSHQDGTHIHEAPFNE